MKTSNEIYLSLFDRNISWFILEKCNLIKFINNYGKPVAISRNLNKGEKKEFVLEGKTYKLNTVFKKVQNVVRMQPVVYKAKDVKTDEDLLLEGSESFILMPGDCDEDFVDVAITSAQPVKPGKYI